PRTSREVGPLVADHRCSSFPHAILMSDTTSTAESAPQTSTPQGPRSRRSARKLFTLLYVVAMVASAGGLVFVWGVWNPTLGAGMTNMVGYSIILLAIILRMIASRMML